MRRWNALTILLLFSGCQPATPAWQLTADTIGPIRFGAPQSTVAQALGLPGPAAPTVGGCRSWTPGGLPAGLRLMIEDGRVVRADVDSGVLRTSEGAGIGSSEADVGRMYPGITSQPHKYRSTQGWRYLIFRPAGAADSAFRIIFESDGNVVRSFRAGIEPAVEYVEGCG